MPITPSPNRSRPPSFHELDSETFEELTCALHAKEPGVRSAERYGAARDKQYGIDIHADRLDGAGIEVSSAKCYSRVGKGAISQWSDDFLEYWETYWEARGVRRFILVVACPVNSAERLAEIEKERARFVTKGVVYDVWGPRQLQERLRAYPGIVAQFLGTEWIARLCGVASESITMGLPDGSIVSNLVVSQLALLQEALSRDTEQRLDIAAGAIRRGDLRSVAQSLDDLRSGTTWSQLRTTTQARVVRLQGSLQLQYGDLNGATQLADQADEIAPAEEPRLRAVLAMRREGPRAALAILRDPSTRDGVHTRLALLLEAGEIDDAASLLDHPLLRDAHPETERLRAFVELLRGRRREALAAIERAEDREPQWPAIRRAGAIVRYALAHSPAVSADMLLALNPTDLDLVCTDDDAVAMLTEALQRFELLSDDDVDPFVRHQDRLWAIACLCNLRDRLPEAEQRVRALLEADQTDTLGIIWALARGFEIDHAGSIHALRALLAGREASSQHILMLAILLAGDAQPGDAATLLREQASAFDTASEADRHAEWLAEFEGMQAEAEGRRRGPAQGASHQLAQAIQEAEQSGEWGPVEAQFRDLVAQSQPLALPAARALASAERWSAIWPHVEALLGFATAEAIRIAIYTAHGLHQARQVLFLIDSHRGAFPHAVLPNDVRAIEANALLMVGNPAAALSRSSQLVAESPSLTNKLVKANLHLRTGNVAAALPTLREAFANDHISEDVALRLVPIVAAEDQGFARDLFRHAVRKGVPRELAPFAMVEALRLGIEHEATSLMGTVQSLALEGAQGVRAVSLDEVVEVMRRTAKQRREQTEKYLDGAVPVHVFATVSGVNLARLFHLHPPDGTEASVPSPVMIRYGARPLDVALPPIRECVLHLDITALLIAYQLGLLDALERLPHPIHISSTVPHLLLELERQTRPGQPHHADGIRAIVQAADSGALAAIEVPVASIDGVSESPDALVARHYVAVSEDTVLVVHQRPAAAARGTARSTSLRAIVDGLYQTGAIDSREHARVFERLGDYANDAGGELPVVGCRLLFTENTLSVLASEGLLPQILRSFDTSIDAQYLRCARSDAAETAHCMDIAQSLESLRARVVHGIDLDKYRYFALAEAEVHTERKNGTDDDNLPDSPTMRCLSDVLRLQQADTALVWVDDRFVSAYTNQNGNLLIGAWDALRALRRSGLVNDPCYYQALLRLRASGMLYVPIESSEVRYHLIAAPIINEVLQETPALRTLRRYIGLALLCDRHLKIRGLPEGPENRPDEIQFILDTRRLVEDCIIEAWSDRTAPDTSCRARANWLWEALRADFFLVTRPDLANTEIAQSVLMPALQVTALLVRAIEIHGGSTVVTLERRASYFRWLDEAVIAERLDVDPEFRERVVKHLQHVLQNQLRLERLESALDRKLARMLLQSLVRQLPVEVRKRLLADEGFRGAVELPQITAIQFSGLTFEARRFWKRIARARAYGSAHVRPLRARKRFIVRSIRGRPNAVRFSGRHRLVLEDPTFALLDRAPEARTAALQSHIDWFDVPRPRREAEIARIVAIADYADRLQALDEARKRSAASHYAKLLGRLQQRTSLSFQLFHPPSAPVLLDHLRLELSASGAFSDRLERGASSLVDDYGPETTLRRLAGLPVPIPFAARDAFCRLPDAERASALDRLADGARTPLQLLQALRLCRLIGAEADAVFSRTLDRCLREWRQIGPLFIAILTWSDTVVTSDIAWGALPAPERLAVVWIHADRITDSVLALTPDHESATKDFTRNRQRIPRRVSEALRIDAAYACAVATPETITPEALLFHGLGYALGPEGAAAIMTPAQIEAVRALLTIEIADEQAPAIWIMMNREEADNSFGSFLACRTELLHPLDASHRAAVGQMSDLLARLEANSMDPEAWINVWGVARPAIDEAARRRLDAVLQRFDFTKFIANDPSRISIARLIVDLWIRCGSESLRSEMLAQLLNAAGALSSPRPGGTEGDDTLMQFLEAGFAWARSHEIEEGFSRFGEFMARLAEARPQSNTLLRQIVSEIFRRASVSNTRSLWEAFNRIRRH